MLLRRVGRSRVVILLCQLQTVLLVLWPSRSGCVVGCLQIISDLGKGVVTQWPGHRVERAARCDFFQIVDFSAQAI